MDRINNASRNTSLDVLGTLLGGVRTCADGIRDSLGLAPTTPKLLPWRSYILVAAEMGADVIDLAPKLFAWFPVSPVGLRTASMEIRLLTEARSFLGELVNTIDSLLSSRKLFLAYHVSELHSGIQKVVESPLTPPEMKEELLRISAPLRDEVARQASAIKTKRQNTIDRLDEAEQRALRDNEPKDQPQPAAKRPFARSLAPARLRTSRKRKR